MPAQRPTGLAGASTDVVDTVRAYAMQEIVGPVKGLGRWIGYGVGGAVCVSLGVILLLTGLLRALQTETGTFDGTWSFVPYLIVLVVAGLVIALAVSRISRTGLPGDRKGGR